MANELVGSVTATPTGPVTIGLGQSLDIVGRFTLNGPSGGTLLSRSMSWQHIAPGAPSSFGTEFSPAADTDYTKTCPASGLSTIGEHTLRVRVDSVFNAPPPFGQTVDANLITVIVANVREVEVDLPDRNVTAGLPSRSVDAELPSREVVAGLPSREVEATLPARTVTAGVVD